jgi:hypothetical protein
MSAAKQQTQPEEAEDERRDTLVPTSSSGSDRGAGDLTAFSRICFFLIPPSPYLFLQVKT